MSKLLIMRAFLFFLLVIPFFANSQTCILPGQIYNFDFGDEFHYLWNHNGGGKKIKQTFVAKLSSSKYVFDREIETSQGSSYPSTFSSSRDTITFYSYSNDTVKDTILPCNSMSHPFIDSSLSDSTLGFFKCYFLDSLYTDSVFGTSYSFVESPQHNFSKTTIYSKGLGIILENVSDFDPFGNSYSKRLVYYKKSVSGNTGGTPWTFNVGLNEINSLEFSIYPNPTSNSIQISGIENSKTQYEIHNSLGKLVISGSLVSQKIDCSTLSNGIYFLKLIDSDNNSGVKRIVVAR